MTTTERPTTMCEAFQRTAVMDRTPLRYGPPAVTRQ